MKKKIIFLFCVLILVLALGGFFYWQQHKEIKGSPNDYVIKQTSEGTFVENKKAGLVVKVPEGWKAEKIKREEGFILLFPTYIKIKWENNKPKLPLKNGCLIDLSVIYKKMNFADIKLDAQYSLSFLKVKSQNFEEIEVHNKKALKNSFDTEKIGPGLGIDILYKNKVYVFYLYWSPEHKKTCLQKFNTFLDQISIQ